MEAIAEHDFRFQRLIGMVCTKEAVLFYGSFAAFVR